MKNYYKLTDQEMQTYDNLQYEIGVWKKATGEGTKLCSDGFLHCYPSPEIASFMNPIHAVIANPRIFECDCKGKSLNDNGLKLGFKEIKLTKEISLPEITTEQRAAIAILCTLEVYKDKQFVQWAENWLNGTDRSEKAAAAEAENWLNRTDRSKEAANAWAAARAAAWAAAWVAYWAAAWAAAWVAYWAAAEAAAEAAGAAYWAARVAGAAADAADRAAATGKIIGLQAIIEKILKIKGAYKHATID